MSNSSPHVAAPQHLPLGEVLKKYWGYDAFRPMQEDVMNAILAGKDTLALMPTGGGKSLCYQVPALAMDGICLVISPLIALMKDQVENLKKRNITAFAVFSGMSWKEVRNTLKTVAESNCKFLYVSPERLETDLFKEYLPGMNIRLIAVDEAHCISQWGYDFRPSYLKIAALREELPGIPILALTASATPEVQLDICEKLTDTFDPQRKKNDWSIFRQSFERPSLSYSVFSVDTRINKIIEIFSKVPGSGIVYCKSRKRTREITELLQLQQISADYYHAGLSQEERNNKQEGWINNKIRVIVCTNAFGMGIDKPDVRTVVHADTPDCLENYYQEAGRAGRDGKRSYAVLLSDEKEIRGLQDMVAQRFPSQKQIREIYQAAANYLQLPSGLGQGTYYDFDLLDFTKKFKLNTHVAMYSLKALEQEGWLSFNDQVFLPATIQFNVTKEYLYEFEKNNAPFEPLIKTLLRAYEGIFDHPSFISEIVIAQLLRSDAQLVKLQLTELHNASIIDYKPRKDKPQLLLLRDRARVEDIEIDMPSYNKRKNKLTERVKEITRYVKEQAQCRSQFIAAYFGDNSVKACGICDNCLRNKSLNIGTEEFETISTRILSLLSSQAIRPAELLVLLNGIKKEKAWKVIEFLQAENKIIVNDDGLIECRK